MPLPVAQLTTILLLIHLGFGCCFHHAHVCEIGCCSAPVATADACPCDTHRHDDVPTGSPNGADFFAGGGHHGEQHQCDDAACNFVSSRPVADRIDELTTDVCPLAARAAEIGSPLAQRGRGLGRPVSFVGSSLRTHLALRVLLI